MKKIFKFVAPNGEYVKWGEFDEKMKILTFEVERYSEEGVLIGKSAIDAMLPEDFNINSEIKIVSSYSDSMSRRCEPPRQIDDYHCEVGIDPYEEDNRKILND